MNLDFIVSSTISFMMQFSFIKVRSDLLENNNRAPKKSVGNTEFPDSLMFHKMAACLRSMVLGFFCDFAFKPSKY